MRFGKLLITSTFILAGTCAAEDQSPWYFGLFYDDAQFDPSSGQTGDLNNINFKLGHDYSPFWGVEVHGGKDVSGDGGDLEGSGVAYLAVLARGNIPLNRINVYGLLGPTYVSADFTDVDGSYTNLAAGVGVELYGNENTAVGLEYIQYGFDDIYKTIGVGIVHHFNWPELR